MSLGFETASMFYELHYHEKIAANLTEEQKEATAKKISGLTLRGPIWLDRKTDHIEQFPELKSFITVKLTGLYLCGIMTGIVNELYKGKTDCRSR